MSLGVICSQVYDPSKHRGQEIHTDAVDGKKYVRQRIQWFIKQVGVLLCGCFLG
jgi:hypothetical protein